MTTQIIPEISIPGKIRSTRNSSEEKVIEVRGLTKSYNDKKVLNNLSLHLHRGEALGILGPNGTGKTTLLETIEGLRKIDQGEVFVLGHNLRDHAKTIQKRIGIQLQKTSLFGKLTVKENVKLFVNLYSQKHKSEDLLRDVDLLGQKDQYINSLSGGQFQRLKLCLALINSPEIIFLDEPTTGLDPAARAVLWDRIRNLIDKGTSVVLTTHYMEEAETLCDRIAIMYKGSIIANDTPANLVRQLGFPRTIILDLAHTDFPDDVFQSFKHIVNEGRVYVYAENVSEVLHALLIRMSEYAIQPENINIHEANLEDVFMELTHSRLATTN